QFDEIWAPSSFTLDAVSRLSPIPVVRIPLCLPEVLPTKPWSRSRFGLPRDQFLFLFMFDFHSFLERKNPLGLIRAFRKAFGKRDRATLVLKCSHSTPESRRMVEEAAGGAKVHLLDAVLSREETNTLVSLCDCY